MIMVHDCNSMIIIETVVTCVKSTEVEFIFCKANRAPAMIIT